MCEEWAGLACWAYGTSKWNEMKRDGPLWEKKDFGYNSQIFV